MEKIRLGRVSDIPPGGSRTFRTAGRDLIVVNTGHVKPDGHVTSELRGYVNFCTHMGGKLRCHGEHFQCDWHGARFVCRTGEAVPDTAAPEGSKLETIELAIEGDDLFYLHIPKKSPWALE